MSTYLYIYMQIYVCECLPYIVLMQGLWKGIQSYTCAYLYIYIYTYTYQRVPLYGTVPLVSCPEMHVDILPQCHSDIELITHFSDRISSMYGSTVMARYTRSKSLK